MVGYLISVIMAFSIQGNWNWVSTGPDGGTILSVASDGNTVIATAPSNVWRYDGSSWSLVFDNISNPEVINTGPGKFCVISSDYDSINVYVSTNGGTTWNHTFWTMGGLEGYSRVNGSYVYIATHDRLYISSDGGQSWQAGILPYSNFGIRDVALTYLPDSPTTVYLAITADSAGIDIFRLYKSTNGGSTWTVVSTQDLLMGTVALTINPNNPQELVAAVSIGEGSQYPGLYISTDGGTSWSYIISSLATGLISVRDLVFYNDTLFVASTITPGIARGVQVGGVWFFTRLDTIHMVQDLHINSDGTMYCSYSGGVMMSVDRSNFMDITNGLKATYIPEENGIVGNMISRACGGTIYLTDDVFSIESEGPVFSNVIYRSTDHGMTWEKIFVPGIVFPMSVQIPENDPSIVYLSGIGYEITEQGGFLLHSVYRSDDSGRTFVAMDDGFSLDSLAGFYSVFWVSPADPNTILAKFVGFDKGWKIDASKDYITLMYSTDGGHSFSALLPNTVPLRAASSNDTIVLGAFYNNAVPAVMISMDRGMTWYTLSPIMSFPLDVEVSGGYVYLATTDITNGNFLILRTMPGQASWDTLSDLPTFSGVRDAKLSSVGNYLAFEVIADTGSPFNAVGTISPEFSLDLPDFRITDIALVVFYYPALLAFTPGHGVYYTEDPFVGISERGITPHPVTEIIYSKGKTLLSVKTDGSYRLEIYDPTGRKRFDRIISDRRIDLGALVGNGVYFFRLKTRGFEKSGKFIVTR